MKFPTLLVCLVLVCANVIESYLPAHYNDFEELLLKQMNFSVNPCEDFYTYACGGITEDYNVAINNENERILKNGLAQLQHSDTHDHLMSSEAISKAVQYYSACVREHVRDSHVAHYTRKTVATFLQKFNLNLKFFFDANADVNIDRTNFSEILRFVHDDFHDEPFFSTGFNSGGNADLLGHLVFGYPAPIFTYTEYTCVDTNDLLDEFIGGVRTVMTTLKLKASKPQVKEIARELMELEIQFLGVCHKDNSDGSGDGSAEDGDENESEASSSSGDNNNESEDEEEEESSSNGTESSDGDNDDDDSEDSTSTSDAKSSESKNFINLDELTFDAYNFDFGNYVKKIVTYGAGDNVIDFDNFHVTVNHKRLPEILADTSDATLLRYIIFRSIITNNKVSDCDEILTQLPMIKSRIYTETKYSSVMEREAIRSLMTTIIASIKKALKNMVTSMPWIQDDKKAYKMLVKKFNKMKFHVAIESDMLNNTWIDKYYEQIEFNDDDKFLDMHSKVIKFVSYEKVRSLIYPTVNMETDTTENNAAYDPQLNKFVIFDGYLVAPFYHSKYPLSYNLGNTGGTIGHEIAHSVDNTCIKYDDTNKENPFLGEAAEEEFKEMTGCLVDHYNKIEVLPESYEPNTVNGTETLGENMADISGIDAAYRTYKDLQKKYGQEARLRHPKLSKLTQDQIFFIGFAVSNYALTSDDNIYDSLQSDPHAPSKARILGTLQNLPAFGEAFNCPVGSNYRPEKYCKVWTP